MTKPILASEHKKDTPTANTAAVITETGVAGRRLLLTNVMWSYNADPTNGRITIESPIGTTRIDLDITSKGPAKLNFDPFQTEPGDGIKVTLAAGGTNITGKINGAVSLL